MLAAFVLSIFICLLKAEVLRKLSGEGLNRICINFPVVSFNVLMYQNEHMERLGSFSHEPSFLS